MRTVRTGQGQADGRIKIGVLGAFSIVLAVILFMFATTFSTASREIFLTAVIMMISGLVLASLFIGIKIDLRFTMHGILSSILWSAISVVVIYMVNRSVPFTLGLSPLDERSFAVLMGVTEEIFFRVFILGFTLVIVRVAYIGIPASSLIWTVYHLNRYHGDPNAFWTLFFAGLVLGAVMYISKEADGVIFAHALVNFLATM